MTAWFAPRAATKAHQLALESESFGECATKSIRVTGVIGVISRALFCGRHMERMVDIVIPLCGVVERLPPDPFKRGCLILFVFQYQMHLPLKSGTSNPRRQFVQNMGLRVVLNGMYCVKPETIEVEFGYPINRVLDDKFPYQIRSVRIVVYGRAPGRLVVLGKDRRICREVVSIGAKVIVDNVKEYHDFSSMRRVDQRLKVVGPAIAGIRREQQYAVVSPVAATGKVGDRHDLDGGDSEVSQIVQPIDRAAKRAFLCEGPDVYFINDGFFPRPPRPCAIVPLVAMRIDNFARPVHIRRLKP